jgi:hypothetical protein
MALSTKLELSLSANSNGTCNDCHRCVPAGAFIQSRGICYECSRRHAGNPTTEGHHVFGRSEPIVVHIPANLHRAINRRQEARRPILKQKTNDPLLGAAQLFTIIAELAEAIADYARCLALPDWISNLADIIANACRNAADRQLSIHVQLVQQSGPDWHKQFVRS